MPVMFFQKMSLSLTKITDHVYSTLTIYLNIFLQSFNISNVTGTERDGIFLQTWPTVSHPSSTLLHLPTVPAPPRVLPGKFEHT